MRRHHAARPRHAAHSHPLRIRILLRIRTSWHGRHRVIGRALPFLYMIVLFGSLKIYSAGLKMIPAAG
jgi:hypothetical protein